MLDRLAPVSLPPVRSGNRDLEFPEQRPPKFAGGHSRRGRPRARAADGGTAVSERRRQRRQAAPRAAGVPIRAARGFPSASCSWRKRSVSTGRQFPPGGCRLLARDGSAPQKRRQLAASPCPRSARRLNRSPAAPAMDRRTRSATLNQFVKLANKPRRAPCPK